MGGSTLLKDTDKIIEENINLVHYVIKKHYPYFLNTPYYDDVVQEGLIGLLRSLDYFNESLGNKFSTYAYASIKHAIQKKSKDFLTPTNMPRGALFVYKDYVKLSEEGLSLNEIAVKLGMGKGTLQGIVNVHEYESLDKEVYNDGEGTPILLSDSITYEIEEDFSKELRTCKTLLKLLPTKLSGIFVKYLNGATQVELGKEYKLTQVSISRNISKVKTMYLPIFKEYIDGNIGYGKTLLKVYEYNKDVKSYLKCYIDYAFELYYRGHKVKEYLDDELRFVDLVEVKKVLDYDLHPTISLLKLINVIDKYCSAEFIEELIDDMVGVYDYSWLDVMVENTFTVKNN